MLQRYKLRLGDGTVLLVDLEGLSTWLVDRKATVQVGRSGKWCPLKQFLAQERAAARRDAQLRAALVPPPPKDEGPPSREDTPAPSEPPPPREDGLALVPPPSREDALVVPLPSETEPPVAEPALPSPPEVLGGPEPAAESGSVMKVSVGEPRLVGDEAPGRPALSVPTEAIEPAPMDGPPAVQVLAEEPAVPGSVGHEVPAPSVDRPITEDPAVIAPPRIQALADEPAAIDPAARQPIPITDLPVVPLKPLHDEPPPVPEAHHRKVEPAFPIAPPSIGILADEPAASPAERPGARSSPRFEAFWRDRRTVAALGLAGRLGTFLSRCLDPINRLERGQPPFVLEERPKPLVEPPLRELPPSSHSVHRSPEIHPLAEEPTSFDEEPQPPSTDDSLPIIPFKTDDDPIAARSATRARDLFVRAAGWVEGLKERVARLTHRDRPQLSISSQDPAAPPAPPPHAVKPAPREALRPPPAISELPALRLAAPDEPREHEDVYDDDGGEDIASLTWLWTKRLAWATALVVVGVSAATNRDVWLPPAAEIGERTLTEIDERVRDGHFAQQQQLAVEEVARELPYLAPETIRRIMSRSPVRVLDAPDVFEIAGDATKRGLPSLSADDAEELETLQRELLATLRPEERERIRALDRARDIGAAFPFDTRQGLRLYARGARKLPSESRERLRELFGRAIAAGLDHRPELTTTASAD